MTDYGEETDVDFPAVRTRQEAVTEFGRDAPFYIWACYDITCLDDCDWYNTPDTIWRRND